MSSIYAKYGADMTCADCSGELVEFFTYLFPLVKTYFSIGGKKRGEGRYQSVTSMYELESKGMRRIEKKQKIGGRGCPTGNTPL